MYFIGQNIRHFRLKNNWKQEFVAKQMNISQGTLSRIENDSSYSIDDDEIERFAKVLNTSSEELKKIPPMIRFEHNNIKGDGYAYIHHQTQNGNEQYKEILNYFQEISQQMMNLLQEIKSDKSILKEETNQLRIREEKWINMIMDLQSKPASDTKITN
jgi:transcriptional regulator with XRE-family HTH domain